MSAPQAEQVNGRIIQIGTIAHVNPPHSGFFSTASTAPDITLGPVAPAGLPTTGFCFSLENSIGAPVTPGAGGFTITPWVLLPGANIWASGVAVTGIDFNQLWLSFDVDACGLFFQVTNVAVDGTMYMIVSEL